MITENGTTSNFDSQRQRAKQKALKNGLTESFTEHDLQVKTASDLENLEQRAQLLQHTSSSTTQSIYRRKPDVVLPFTCETWDNFLTDQNIYSKKEIISISYGAPGGIQTTYKSRNPICHVPC